LGVFGTLRCRIIGYRSWLTLWLTLALGIVSSRVVCIIIIIVICVVRQAAATRKPGVKQLLGDVT
jgi:hypothetical protein